MPWNQVKCFVHAKKWEARFNQNEKEDSTKKRRKIQPKWEGRLNDSINGLLRGVWWRSVGCELHFVDCLLLHSVPHPESHGLQNVGRPSSGSKLRAKILELRAQSQEPRAQNPELRDQSSELRAQISEPRAQSLEFKGFDWAQSFTLLVILIRPLTVS